MSEIKCMFSWCNKMCSTKIKLCYDHKIYYDSIINNMDVNEILSLMLEMISDDRDF